MLVWLGPALLVMGFVTHQLWKQWPTGRFAELIVIALFVFGIGRIASRWVRGSPATLITITWCLLLVLFAGPIPALATGLMFLATASLGGLVFPRRPLLLQALLGALMLAGLVGWLLPLPIHYGWVYLLIFLGAVLWRRQALHASLQAFSRHWSEAVTSSPRMATFAVLVVGLATTAAWLPTLQYDDLVYHLRLPWQLQMQGFYRPAPEFQVWALAPWASDVLQALPQLIGRQEARGAVNVAWLVIMAGGLWQLCVNVGAPAASRWSAIALAASLPLTAALAASMQTEPLTAAALVWMAALIAGPRDAHLSFWLALAVLAGGLAATKLVAASMAGVVLLWALVRHPWRSPLKILSALALGMAVASSSYAYAWLVTGNPILPLFNAWFKSTYFPFVNFADARWHAGLGLRLPWDMTFDTGRYMEAYPGAAGFMLIALCGVWLSSLFRPQTRALAAVSTCVLLLPLIPMQYLRYAYPGLVLLCAVLATALGKSGSTKQMHWLLIAVCVLNLSFQASSSWMLRSGALKSTVKAAGRDGPLMAHFVPERALARSIKRSGEAEGTVMLLDAGNPFFAEFGSRGRTISWYSPSLQQAARLADRDQSGMAWRALLQRQNVRHVILRTDRTTPAQQQALRMLGAQHRQTVAEAEWWTIPASQLPGQGAMSLPSAGSQPSSMSAPGLQSKALKSFEQATGSTTAP